MLRYTRIIIAAIRKGLLMNAEEYKKAAEYWTSKECVEMPADQLLSWAEAFFTEKTTCALATGRDDGVRCTPLEYSYHDGAFWIFTEGGLKFANLEHNKNVCLAIFDQDAKFGALRSAQVEGEVEIVEPLSDVYLAHAEYKNVPEAALRKLAGDGHPMHLLRITPTRADILCSAFKGKGYDSRQSIGF